MNPGSTLTYREVGATLSGELPAGYHHLRRTETIGEGRAVFELAARSILNWDMHRGAGFDIEASSTEARADLSHTTRVKVSWGVGPVRLTAPCEVVAVVDEDDRRGFVYGTLPGHPETGEEAFLVSIGENDMVTMDVVAFSRPSRWYAKLAGRFGPRVQSVAAGRYIRALRKLAN
jgi:uncharacterized protein (UPF0548 family)